MELHDENEKMLLEADPITVLVEFGHVIGVKLMDLFLGKTFYICSACSSSINVVGLDETPAKTSK